MRNTLLVTLFAVLAVAPGTRAQTNGTTAPGGTSGINPNGGGVTGTGIPSPVRSPSLPTTPSTSGNNQNSIANQRPIFISGKVMADDGSPLPMNVVIQKVCGGNARSVAYTDGRGQFNFQWNQTQGFLPDASESAGGRSSGGFGSAQSAGGINPLAGDPFGVQFTNCEIRAQLAGFRSDVINLASRNPMDNPDVGMIVLHRLGNVEGTSVSITALAAPKDAKKSFDKGLQLLLKNKSEDAAKEFEKAVLAYPKYADAWVSLGQIRMRQNAFEPARDAMLRAIEADAKLVIPYIDLGLMAVSQQKWEEAGQYLDRGLHLDPVDYPQAWYADAVANYNLHKFDVAEKSALEALKLDVRHTNPRIQYLRGMIMLERRDYTGSAEQLRDYLKYAPAAPDAARVKEQLAQLDKVTADTKEASKQ